MSDTRLRVIAADISDGFENLTTDQVLSIYEAFMSALMSDAPLPSKKQLPAGITPDQKLRAFVRALFEAVDWPDGGDIDGFEFQELAVEHGLLIPETRTEPCCDEESCHCAQYHGVEEMKGGVTCYRKVAWLNAARPDETTADPCDHDYVWKRYAERYECEKCGAVSEDGADHTLEHEGKP